MVNCRAIARCFLVFVATLVSFFFHGSVHACLIYFPFDESIIDDADIIFRGRITSYELIHDHDVARLAFDVEETLFGEHASTRVAVWTNSTAAFPEDLSGLGSDVVVGLMATGWDYRCWNHPDFPLPDGLAELRDLPWILEENCHVSFMSRFDEMEAILQRRGILQ